MRQVGSRHISLTINILWKIWKRRNNLIFRGETDDPRQLIHEAIKEWQEMEEVFEVKKDNIDAATPQPQVQQEEWETNA